ncbi:VWA domain-containing protein [Croceiramulus getboli]|nr:VWA domain-containing protein [Flavobacteriaceae bacterium YJPT1-3]
MQNSTLLFLFLAIAVAMGFAAFQYAYRSELSASKRWTFAGLRFLSVLGLLLLLIDPKLEQVSYYTEKAQLALLVDNTASIAFLEQEEAVKEVVAHFRETDAVGTALDALEEQFDLNYYSFSGQLQGLDTLGFSAKGTRIAQALKDVEGIHNRGRLASLLLSDGNQTYGEDYSYFRPRQDHELFTVMVGDTMLKQDLTISRINLNKYAYINNTFPVEAIISRSGDEPITSTVRILSSNQTLARQTVRFGAGEQSRILNFELPASRVGLQRYTLSIDPLDQESNTQNNSRRFAIEVIDQKSKIVIIANQLHPDLGLWKKSIERNELREVSYAKPDINPQELESFDLVILFQPDAQFESVYRSLDERNANRITHAGDATSWGVLNSMQNSFNKPVTNQTDEVLAVVNPGFSSFDLGDFEVNDLPPLSTTFGGAVLTAKTDIMLYQRIGNVVTDQPLIALLEQQGHKEILIDGVGLWKWRAQQFVNTGSFDVFDDFISSLIQFTASSERRNRLEVDFEPFYYGSQDVIISAQYFDKNYQFDGGERVVIQLTHEETGKVTNSVFLRSGNAYRLDLSNLDPGAYRFRVSVPNQNLSSDGSFTIIPFQVEEQFINPDRERLERLSQGRLYTTGQIDALIEDLLDDPKYLPVQKSRENIVSLISWEVLLILLILLLSAEWFLRKYNGLI